jgi:arginine decarboxylase
VFGKALELAAGSSGAAEGGTILNAFDKALLVAGLGNINLVKISSILPPGIRVAPLPRIRPGSLVPTAYAAMSNDVLGTMVAVGVGWALPENRERAGVIMEVHEGDSARNVEHLLERMLVEAFRARGEERIQSLQIFTAEHRVERIGCAVAAVTLLSTDDIYDDTHD